MTDVKLDIAFWNYDRTRFLSDGTVKIDGVDASFHSARIVPEPGLPALGDLCQQGERHQAAGGPGRQDGRRAGALRPRRGRDAEGDAVRRARRDAQPVPLDRGRHRLPDEADDYIPQPHPGDVEVSWADAHADLGTMLEAGEIDALVSADIPECVLEKSPKVGRLFEDYEAAERAYYQRTGIFPIMHTVVVKKELAAEHPEIVKAIHKGFCDAKAATAGQLVKGMTFNSMATMVPWLTKLIGDNRDLLGDDWWPYGIEANRKALDTYLRCHFEQGLSKRRMTCEDIFVPEPLGT